MNFITSHWQLIGLIIAVIIIIVLIIKRPKKAQYHNQIKENKKAFVLENSFNPTPIKYIRRFNKTWRVFDCRIEGRIPKEETERKERAFKEWSKIEIKNLEWISLKSAIKGEPKPEITKYIFTIKTKNLFKILWYGETEILELEPKDFSLYKKDYIIRVNETVNIVYFKGVLCPLRPSMIDTVTEDTVRVMRDLEINASGSQEKEFSRIDANFAHAEVMKEKDIEYEKEKKKPTFASG